MSDADLVEKLRIHLEIDGKKAQAATKAINDDMRDAMKSISEATGGVDESLKDALKAATKFGSGYAKNLKLSSQQVNILNKKMKTLPSSIKEVNDALKAQKAALAKTSKDNAGADAKVRKAAEARVKEEITGLKKLKEELEDQKTLLEDIESLSKSPNFGKAFKEATEEAAGNFRKEMESSFKGFVATDFKATTNSLKESFSEAASSLGSKNFTGMAKGLGGMIGGLGKGLAAGVTKGAMKVAPDKMASALGAVAGTLGKMGPLLGMVAGGAMALVKLFIDAQAAAKEFNRDLLATASTSQYLTKAGGDSTAAYESLKATLDSVRESAYNVEENLDWGIQAKDHVAFLNVLTQEGVTLKDIQKDADAAGVSVGKFSADMVHVGVAYSRTFGVSLNEISTFQAEMMTELGSNAKDVSSQFASMAGAADDAGIASNKFFGIIRGISTDLSLYNMRLEDSVHLLSMVGKVMSPRNAQKFMQETLQGFKNMGRTEKLKMGLLLGDDKRHELLKNDFASKKGAIQSTLQKSNPTMDAATMEGAIEHGGDALKKALENVPEEMRGAVTEQVSQYQIDKSRAGKGQYGESMALGNMGMGGVLDAYKSVLTKFAPKGTTLKQGAGTIGVEQMAENMGVSSERMDAMIKVEDAVKDQKNSMIRALEKEGKDTSGIEKMTTQQLLDAMSASDRAKLNEDTKIRNYAMEQTGLQKDLLSKIDTIMEFLLNRAYNLLDHIADGVLALWKKFAWGAADETIRKKDEQGKIFGAKNPALEKAYNDSGGDMWKTKGAVMGTSGKAFQDSLGSRNKEYAGLAAQLKKMTDNPDSPWDPKKKKAIEDRMGQLKGQKEGVVNQISSSTTMDQQIAALKMMQGEATNHDSEGKLFKAIQEMEAAKGRGENINATTALDRTGGAWGAPGSDMDPDKFLGKSLWAMEPQQLFDLLPGLAAFSGTPVATPAGPAVSGAVMPGAATVSPPAMAAEKPATVKQADEHIEATKEVVQATQATNKTLTGSDYKKTVGDATLEAIRTGLYEYWMYSGLDRNAFLAAGGNRNMATSAASTGEGLKRTATVADLKPNGVGGVVVRPAPGELIASVAPGESIVPPGGSGGGAAINLTVNGIGGQDLANYLRDKINEGIYEYKRREKFN